MRRVNIINYNFMLKNNIYIYILLSLFYTTSYAIDFSIKSNKENDCSWANVNTNIYIKNWETSTWFTVYDAFWHSNDRFIANSWTTVKLWQSNNLIVNWCLSSSSWSKWSDIAPWNNEKIVALYSKNCIFNKPTNINNKTLQFIFNIRHWSIWWWSTSRTRYYYPLSWWYNNPVIRNSKTYNNYFVKDYIIHSNECLNITLAWCWDWVLDTTKWEACDPNDPNKTLWGAWGCDNVCKPIIIPPLNIPTCSNLTVSWTWWTVFSFIWTWNNLPTWFTSKITITSTWYKNTINNYTWSITWLTQTGTYTARLYYYTWWTNEVSWSAIWNCLKTFNILDSTNPPPTCQNGWVWWSQLSPISATTTWLCRVWETVWNFSSSTSWNTTNYTWSCNLIIWWNCNASYTSWGWWWSSPYCISLSAKQNNDWTYDFSCRWYNSSIYSIELIEKADERNRKVKSTTSNTTFSVPTDKDYIVRCYVWSSTPPPECNLNFNKSTNWGWWSSNYCWDGILQRPNSNNQNEECDFW